MPSYSPPPELENFLRAGPLPVYIGFGSIVVDDPESLLKTVLEAVNKAGVRAIVSKGWSNLPSSTVDDKTYFIGDCPHGKWIPDNPDYISDVDITPKNGSFSRYQPSCIMGVQELLPVAYGTAAQQPSYHSLESTSSFMEIHPFN